MTTQLMPAARAGAGLGFIMLAAVVLALGDGLVKIVSEQISVWQLVLLRSLIAVPALLVMLILRRRCAIWPKRRLWVVIRSLLLVGMWLLVYAALPSLDMPTVSAALYTAPLLITVLSAIGSRRLGDANLPAVAVGFVGVLLLLRPGTDAFSPMLLLPLAAAVLYALAALVTGAQCRDESPLVLSLCLNIVFLMVGVFGVVLLAWHPLPALAAHSSFIFGGMRDLAWPVALTIVALAAILVTANICMARAYQTGPAPVVAAGDYSYLVFSAFWSVLLFQALPDTLGLCGIGLIILAGVQSMWWGRRCALPRRRFERVD
ncbi:DMT family transporter [Salinisphaera aquimarina]|uniref:DMT family transporter n=1 Tax=Salinisphaera aquimarina TaxID=2094031 RepID=A0ABV7EPT7_9GAMM